MLYVLVITAASAGISPASLVLAPVCNTTARMACLLLLCIYYWTLSMQQKRADVPQSAEDNEM